MLLVDRDRQHLGIVVKHRLGAVAVMHIPIQHHHPLRQPGGLRGTHRDADIVEQAEPVGQIGQAMMPRRA